MSVSSSSQNALRVTPGCTRPLPGSGLSGHPGSPEGSGRLGQRRDGPHPFIH